jgi:hypothetical protein
MHTPSSYLILRDANLLNPEGERLDNSYLWLEGVNWLQLLGPDIEIPNGARMVPFGWSAYGDWWCWSYRTASEECDSVILSPPDTGDCTHYAPSFEAFLFRKILRFLSNDVFALEPDPEGVLFTLEEIQAQISIWISQLEPILEKTWVDSLLELVHVRDLKTYVHPLAKYKYKCLLLPERESELSHKFFRYPLLDRTFKFDRLKVNWFIN